MSKVFYLNTAGVRSEILKSNDMRKLISRLASSAAKTAINMNGQPWEGKVIDQPTRVAGIVHPTDSAGYFSALKHNTAEKVKGTIKL